MVSLDVSKCLTRHSQCYFSEEKELPLPLELFIKITKYLDFREMQSACSVNSYWKAYVIYAATCPDYSAIKRFAKVIISSLPNSYADQKASLTQLQLNMEVLPPNLMAVQPSICKWKGEFLNILKRVEQHDLLSLNEKTKDKVPEILKNYQELAKCYMDFDLVTLLGDKFLLETGTRLAWFYEFDKALEACSLMQDLEVKKEFLLTIYSLLREDCHLIKAAEIAVAIGDQHTLETILGHRVFCCVEVGQLGKAKAIANTILDRRKKSLVLSCIALAYIDHGYSEKGYKIACEITRRDSREETLSKIGIHLCRNGRLLCATKIADALELRKYNDAIYLEIVESLLVSKQNDEALAMTCALGKLARSEILSIISMAYLNEMQINKAIEVAKSIPDEKTKETTLENLFTVMLEKGYLADAEIAISQIGEKEIQDHLLQKLSSEFAKKLNVSEARRVALMITNGHHRDVALLSLFRVLKQIEDLVQAKDSVQMLSDTRLRDSLLLSLSK